MERVEISRKKQKRFIFFEGDSMNNGLDLEIIELKFIIFCMSAILF